MAFNWGNAGSGALAGATAGSSILPGWGTAIGAGLGALSGFQDNPADQAQKYLDQIPETLRPYFEPYFKAGTGALGDVNSEYSKLISDPNAIIQKLGSGYRQSPGYQWKLNQAEQGITNAAAANGMAGSNQHQQNAGELAGHLADQDFQSFMDRITGLYGTGLQGKQTVANQGQTAGSDFGLSLGGNLQSKAKLGYEGQASQNRTSSDLLANLIALLKNPNGGS